MIKYIFINNLLGDFMLIPSRLGNIPPTSPFIFTAGDSKYFEIYGKPLVNSILQNTKYHVHIHLYNPSTQHLDWLVKDRVSFSYEYVDKEEFCDIAADWLVRKDFNNIREKQMFDKGQLYGEKFLQELIRKTYYACCRFIRLSEILKKGSRCLAIDIDGLVRADFPMVLENENHDFYLYRKPSGEHLAGAILFTERSKKFLVDYSNHIAENIVKEDLYWFMDQIELDKCVPKYNAGVLPMSYIDWEMDDNSSIWSAKGKRKDTIIFLDEQKKYNS